MKAVIPMLFLLTMVLSIKATENKTGINLYRSGLYGPAKVFFLKQEKALTDPAQKTEACYYLGNSYLMLGMPDSAAVYYQKGVEIAPEYPYNYIGQGKLQMKVNQTAGKALLEQAESMKGYKKDAAVLSEIAVAYLYAGDYAGAWDCIARAKKYAPSGEIVYLTEGDLLMAEKKTNEACTKYDMAIYYSSDCIPAYLKLTDIYASTNPASALAHLEKSMGIDAGFPGNWFYQGEVNRSVGNYKKAAEAYRRFIESGLSDTDTRLRYADCLYFSGKYDEALPVIRVVLAKDPDNVVGMRLQAYALAKKERNAGGLESIRKFMTSVPENKLIFQDYLCYAEQLSYAKEYGQALEQYQRALKLDKKRTNLYQDMADIRVRMKDYSGALADYDQYLASVKAPAAEDMLKFGKCYYNMGAQDSVADSRNATLHKADSVFAILTEMVPDSYVGYFWRARTNSLLDPESTAGLAKPFYEKIIEIAEKTPNRYVTELVESYKYLGYYNYVTHHMDAAKACFAKVLEYIPNDEVSQRALKEIK